MKNKTKGFIPGSNPDPETLPPPPPGSDKQWGGFTPLPEPGCATCIRVFQNGNKIMEFCGESMQIVATKKDHIIFYDDLGKKTTIYNNGGIVYIQYKDKQE